MYFFPYDFMLVMGPVSMINKIIIIIISN
jgi:hypothetical protein